MDASPVPRCTYKSFLLAVCLVLAIVIFAQVNVSTYGYIMDSNCLNFTSAFEFEDVGIMNKGGLILLPICSCAFFALKLRKKRAETKIISPPSCRYAKILNC